mmetsp:Transcript_32188/g.85740  ORF Transcript_32188/g.85740 Transcript_32188/m.85740 type:complete len:246 (+) Transcript_32188:132-869(+)
MESWQKTLLIVGGAAGAATILYYLLRDEPESSSASHSEGAEEKISVGEITKDQVLQILNEIYASQEKMKVRMKSLTTEIMAKSTSFDETYQKIKEVQPDDVLERYGLQMQEFDQLLSKHQSDLQVREGIMKIMGAPDGSLEPTKDVTVKKVVDAHNFMLEELENVARHVNNAKAQSKATVYDMKTVALTAQAIVAAKVEEKFGLTSEDMEGAVMKHQRTLATDKDFASINMKMQQVMGQLMGGEM